MRKDTRIIFTIPYSGTVQILEWCNENFGPKHRKRWGHNHPPKLPGHLRWSSHPYMNFYINNKEDAMAFKLRWS